MKFLGIENGGDVRRLHPFKTSLRRYQTATWVLGCVTVILAAKDWLPSRDSSASLQQVVLRDEQGRTRLLMGMNSTTQQPEIVLLDESGIRRFNALLDEGGSAAVDLSDEQGLRRVHIQSPKGAAPSFRLLDADGTEQIILDHSSSSGRMSIVDGHKTTRVSAGVEDGNAIALSLYADTGKRLISLRESGSGYLYLADPAGSDRLVLGNSRQDRPAIWLQDAKGNVEHVVDNAMFDRISASSRESAAAAEAAAVVARTKPVEVKIEPRIERAPPPPKRSADLILKSLTVRSEKANGESWDDENGAPDLRVYIQIDSGEYYDSPTKKNTTSAEWGEKALRVTEGDTLTVTVFDDDAFFDDKVGAYSKSITADTLSERNVNWSFEQVASLRLEFQP